MLTNFLLLGAALPWVYEPLHLRDIGLLAAMAVLAFGAMLFIISAYRRGEAVVVAPMQYSQIVWASLFGAMFFGETPDLPTALGAAIIIASGLYIVLRESRSEATSQTPVLRTRSRFETGTTPRIGVVMRARKDRD
jgi:drug/metabolite transporter (DMT)-like permease